jgi:hypothetical protein
MPVFLVGTLAACAVFANPLRNNIGNILASVDKQLAQISFNSGGGNAATNLWQPSAGIEWILIGALALMLVSKVLQLLEWAVFKLKI